MIDRSRLIKSEAEGESSSARVSKRKGNHGRQKGWVPSSLSHYLGIYQEALAYRAALLEWLILLVCTLLTQDRCTGTSSEENPPPPKLGQ
jgi:hypothetical protein